MNRQGARPRVTVVSADPRLARLVADRLGASGDLEVEVVPSPHDGAPRVDGTASVIVDGADASTGNVLTPRETQVLGLLADGLANKQIAGMLGISDHTVKFHVESIMRRLGAANRAEAVRQGIRRGMLGL